MKKLIIIAFAAASFIVSACNGTDKTNRNSDTSAAKGNSGPADSTQGIGTSSASGNSAATPGSADTTNTGASPNVPKADTAGNP